MTARKQYSSCDQCRRAKRKCITNPGDDRNTCLNCSTRGRTCTFDFAKSCSRQRHRRQRTPILSVQDDQRVDEDGAFDVISVFNQEPFAQDLSPKTSDDWLGVFTFEGSDVLELSTANEFDHESAFSKDDQATFNYESMASWTNRERIPLACADVRSRRQCQLWNGTPMQLLNSTYTKKIMDDCLEEIYESVIFGLESRYLSHTCNVLRPKSRYHFVADRHVNGYTSDSTSATSCRTIKVCTPPSHEPTAQVVTVTFVGLARFLDHFGPLYCNKLDAYSKSEDEKLFLAAHRAFALQWFACENAGMIVSTVSTDRAHMFGAAWHNTRQLIMNDSSHVSFIRLYALLLFHTTGTPVHAGYSEDEKNNLLKQIAYELSVLKELIGRFCENLPATSRYKTLLDTAVKVFEWFIYIKDTTASLLHDRKSILPDLTCDLGHESSCGLHPSLPGQAQESVQQAFSSNWNTDEATAVWDEIEISAMCQKATVHTFELFRQILNLKQSLRSRSSLISRESLLDRVQCAVELVDGFYLSFSSFTSHCSSNFTSLSEGSKLSYCFMMFFWVCAVLSLVEQIRCAYQQGVLTEKCTVFPTIIEYEETALRTGVTICQAFVTASANSQVSLSKNPITNLPHIAHHVNLSLVVEVLQKLIEHVIERDILDDRASREQNTTQFLRMKPLLCCLSELEATLAGVRMARHVRQKLMQSYGDILLEYWTVDGIDLPLT